MLEDELCEILRNHFKCEKGKGLCTANFEADAHDNSYEVDTCSAIKRITRLVWEDTKRRLKNGQK